MKNCFILFFAMLLVGCDMKSEPEFIYVKNGSSYDIEAVYNSESKIVYKNTNEVLPLEDVEFITDKVVNVNGIDNKIQVVEINKTEGFHNSTYCTIYTIKERLPYHIQFSVFNVRKQFLLPMIIQQECLSLVLCMKSQK